MWWSKGGGLATGSGASSALRALRALLRTESCLTPLPRHRGSLGLAHQYGSGATPLLKPEPLSRWRTVSSLAQARHYRVAEVGSWGFLNKVSGGGRREDDFRAFFPLSQARSYADEGGSGSLFDKLSGGGGEKPRPDSGEGSSDPRVYKLNDGDHVQITKPQDHAKCVHRQAPIGPRKLKKVCNMLRGMSVEEALLQCRLSVKKAAKLCEKVILSARANASHNHELAGKDLYVHEIFATKGRYRKRVDYVAKGRAVIKKKYFSHLTVVLREGKPLKEKIRLQPSALQRRERRIAKEQRRLVRAEG
ncbi:ribosomal protein L22 [Chloropicon roscoffensis]|uniref:Large ribosomal subunit protein uL22c n=1 Tax=Chloropicon roscoffensis TaxID=1461544 RepID=A0AAX4NZN1_9CHLO